MRDKVINKSITFWILSVCPLWLIASISESILIADVASIWGTSIMIFCFYQAIGDSLEMTRFLRLGAITLCLVQNLAWLTASLIHHFSLEASIEATIKSLMGGGLKFSSYAIAVLYVCLFSSMISYFGSKKALFTSEKIVCALILKLKNIPLSKITLFIMVITAINILLVVSGVIAQRAIIVDGYSEGERPFWIVLHESILPGQIMLLALLMYHIGNKKGSLFNWSVLIVSLIFMLYIYFTKGRSPLVFALAAIGFWYYYFLERKPKILKLTIIFCVIYPILSQVLLFNNFIRGVNGIADWQSKSAIEILPLAWDRFQSSSGLIKEEEASTTENLGSRPLVATPLAQCLQYPGEKKTFTYGENLFNSFVWAIPGPLIGSKKDYLVQERLLYKHFKIGRDLEQDTADSLYLSSYTEFSWVGLIIYPWLLYLLWFAVITLCVKWKITGFILAINISIFFELFLLGIGEGAVGKWFVILRSFMFWMLLYKLWASSYYGKFKTLNMIGRKTAFKRY